MVVYVSFASTVLCPTDAGTTSAQSRRLSGWWPRWQAVPVHVADATRVCVREGGETVLDALIANGVNAWMASEKSPGCCRSHQGNPTHATKRA